MYGILESSTNTGDADELSMVFAAPMQVLSNQPSFSSDTMSLKRKSVTQDAQRWEISTNVFPSNDQGSSANFLVSSLTAKHTDLVFIRMPQVARPDSEKLAATRLLTLNADTTIGSDVINITGGTLPQGEFINIEGDPKVYIVLGMDKNTGNATVYPNIRSAILSGASIKFGDKVTMKAYYDTDTRLGITYKDGLLSDPGSINLIEAL